ncbi:hypothetical protein J725_4075 [Acinetobacter baumannii 1195185_80]|nr:hypothetical protein J725_4166 [Acinetobacter baumannii 1195185_80]KCY25465.1 hypothetical protein J725_4075 [Acinetobacter baumannii 1195185_80]
MSLPLVSHPNGFHFFRVLCSFVWQIDIDTTIVGRIRVFIDQSIVVIHHAKGKVMLVTIRNDIPEVKQHYRVISWTFKIKLELIVLPICGTKYGITKIGNQLFKRQVCIINSGTELSRKWRTKIINYIVISPIDVFQIYFVDRTAANLVVQCHRYQSISKARRWI